METKEKLAKLDDIFSRGVGEFVDPDGKFRKKVEAKIRGEYPQDIVIKLGVDPNRPDIHLGHAVILRKLRELQDLGCKVIFLIGDYTAQIGDPTGKSKVRPEVEQKEIEKNMQTYLDQVGKILRTDKQTFSWIRNSDWFTVVTDVQATPGMKLNFNKGKLVVGAFDANSFVGKALLFNKTRMQETHLKNKEIHTVSFSYVMRTLRKITHGQLIERDMFQDRIKGGEELFMHEMMYPVLQGLDSHILAKAYNSCDLEVGGTDQHFNMLMGRHVMKMYNQDPQAVLSFELLVGTDGTEKMSKSLDNYIGITDVPNDMYGKVMSVPDSLLAHYYELATFTPLAEIAEIKQQLTDPNINPKDIKMRLARQIVSIYHGEDKAADAEKAFVSTFQEGNIPDDIETISAEKGAVLGELLVTAGTVSSKTEFRRLVEGGVVQDLQESKKITDEKMLLEKSITLRLGKKRFIKIEVEK